MKSIIMKELVLDALLMAIWRRSPVNNVLAHSDQGTQYTSGDWNAFLKQYGLIASKKFKLYALLDIKAVVLRLLKTPYLNYHSETLPLF